MAYDLLIRGGRVVDGSGLPGFVADMGIKNGRVVELGRLRGSAARTIEADGRVVAPGFIDHHTHMDAQLFWDPYATSEPQCGVTSIVMGNCGLTLAPVKDEDGQEGLVKSLCRVEAIPREALGEGVPWGWRSYGDYLDAIERRGLGLNVGGMVGHIAVRQFAMGEESVERAATPAEITQMQALVREAMEGGALGLSTNRNERHMREDGKPVPSRLANDQEFFALCDVLSELNAGIIQTILGLNKPEHAAWYREVAKRTGRVVTWQSVLHRWSEPTLWRQQLDAIAPNFQQGYRTFGLTMTVPLVRLFSLKNAQVFDEFPVWKNLMFLPEMVRKQAFADPATRQKMREDLATPRMTNFHKRWDIVRVHKVFKPEHKLYEGKSVEELGRMRGQDPLDALLDLSLAEDLETVFWNTNSGGDPVAMGEILRSPYVLVGTSDAGAHVQFGADFGYGVTLLGLWVRERGELSLEQAVHKLTFHVASVYGLEGRGLLRPGYAADVVVFDPNTVAAHEAEWVQDYPAGTRRLVQRAEGIHYTIVNGSIIQEEGRVTGELPGQVLRGAAYRARTPALA